MLKVPVNFDGPLCRHRIRGMRRQPSTTDWEAVMDIRKINRGLSVSPQIAPADLIAEIADGGISLDHLQPPRRRGRRPADLRGNRGGRPRPPASRRAICRSSPAGWRRGCRRQVRRGAVAICPGPVLAYCRTGTRSTTLWALAEARAARRCRHPGRHQGGRLRHGGVVRRIANGGKTPTDVADAQFDIVIIGGGAAGISVAASLLARARSRHRHHRPAGHPLLPARLDHGGRRHLRARSHRPHHGVLIPRGVHWIKAAVAAFEPATTRVILDGCRVVKYNRLIVARASSSTGTPSRAARNAGPQRRDLELPLRSGALHLGTGQGLKEGRAIFTQPPMPIKCAGAPQKALYLSGDHWSAPAPQQHRHPVLQCRRRALRRQGLCARA
jgi:sulfide:quinone oxidoreductase